MGMKNWHEIEISCDIEKCANEFNKKHDNFFACLREAREIGWRVGYREGIGQVLCPEHSGKMNMEDS